MRHNKLQLTWKNIIVKAPPKKRICRRIDPEAEDKIILGNNA
jgi:hypothetical protein